MRPDFDIFPIREVAARAHLRARSISSSSLRSRRLSSLDEPPPPLSVETVSRAVRPTNNATAMSPMTTPGGLKGRQTLQNNIGLASMRYASG